MGFDLDALRRAVTDHGHVARVVVADVRGSAPREVGASMLVWQGGQSGTIGGGALEMDAARAALTGGTRLTSHALGPDLGQCCGGAVRLVTEVFTADTLPDLEAGVYARPVASTGEMPLSLRRLVSKARGQGHLPDPQLDSGWFIEPKARATRSVWVWGAGHVGRALVGVLAGLPDIAVTWVDTGPDRFPDPVPDRVTILPAKNPSALVPHAPPESEHLILTYSHTLDLDLCHSLLRHRFRKVGLIGSDTKWARFRSRLRALGHSEARIADIACPIGDPALGKHPQAIAIGVAADLLRPRMQAKIAKKDSA